MDKKIYALSVKIGKKLSETGQWLTCAESCTGGLIAGSITDVAGSSAYFDRGFVTYSNQAKHDWLGVKLQTLAQWGAVSEPTVREMAMGALKMANADIAVSVSGIAGPDGGTLNKPVGTVWFGWASRDGRVMASKRIFAGNRQQVRQQAVYYALSVILEKFL
ncbi:nicotinamide-nucleotide amidase [Budvicia diplopodorum]|uniref:nicotinamide-nucleotide amidase n=1 Tax=Budvicia diplopodorum TaxID=1119056 RepID=UPI0013570502|nr:nicotinamide-nucleotide amidase [Budvicia diplopodorum]